MTCCLSPDHHTASWHLANLGRFKGSWCKRHSLHVMTDKAIYDYTLRTARDWYVRKSGLLSLIRATVKAAADAETATCSNSSCMLYTVTVSDTEALPKTTDQISERPNRSLLVLNTTRPRSVGQWWNDQVFYLSIRTPSPEYVLALCITAKQGLYLFFYYIWIFGCGNALLVMWFGLRPQKSLVLTMFCLKMVLWPRTLSISHDLVCWLVGWNCLLRDCYQIRKLPNSSSDHLPLML